MMESHEVTFPVLSQDTKIVMVSLFFEMFRDGEFDRIMNKLCIGEEGRRQQVMSELQELNELFRHVWTLEVLQNELGLL